MKELYNYSYYHNCCGPIAYENSKNWMEFFGNIADHIIRDINPKTVLDAGCAMGYLVAALRDRGVEAYGIDISEYAISMVREDIKPYCFVGSLTERLPQNMPQRYDLVISIEVLEHLYAEDGKIAIKNICNLSDDILFCSSPTDFTESTHFNVQQREYWARLFAENNFFDDLNYRPTYITPYSIRFRKTECYLRQIEDYERFFRIALSENKESFKSKIYFNYGDGESEENSLSIDVYKEGDFYQKVILLSGCKTVRFDPFEGCGGIVYNLKIRSIDSFLQVSSHNGLQIGDLYLFQTHDPQIRINLTDYITPWIEISAEIVPMGQNSWIELYGQILKHIDKIKALETVRCEQDLEIKSQQKEIQEQNEKICDKENQIEKQKNNFLEKLEEISEQQKKQFETYKEYIFNKLSLDFQKEKENLEKQIDEISEDLSKKCDDLDKVEEAKKKLQSEIQDYSNLVAYERSEHQKIVDALSCIQNSTIWRASKPLRSFLDIIKKIFLLPIKKVVRSVLRDGIKATCKKVRNKLLNGNSKNIYTISQNNIAKVQITGNPIDPIQTILVDDPIKRLNLVTDSINSDSLLGGVATALIVATEFANKYNFELRIITRNSEVNPLNYKNIMKVSGIEPSEKISFYSDWERYQKPIDFKLELGPNDIFFATSWWSAKAIEETIGNNQFFYIIQEVETFFYNFGSEHLMCSQIMEHKNIDFIVNSKYLYDYFKLYNPNIINHGYYFEPAFPNNLYKCKDFKKKSHYKLFFYARPNNPRNLYSFGIEVLDKAISLGILDTSCWDIYCVGQNAPEITFCNGYKTKNMGQLSWTEYADFLSDVDLGLCLMYTPHPSYPPYDVACSGGVVLSNKMLNKVNFIESKNVILADLEEKAFMDAFKRAVNLAQDPIRRKENFEENTICHDWKTTLEDTILYMGRCLKIV